MGGIDVVYEDVIDAEPVAVFRAIEDLTRGTAQWWLPRVEVRPRSAADAELVGFEYDVVPRRPRGPHSTLRIVEVDDHEVIRYEYFDCLLPGRGTMTLKPVEGKTRVSYRWQVRPRYRVLRILNPVVKRTSSRVYMPAFFDGLRGYVQTHKLRG